MRMCPGADSLLPHTPQPSSPAGGLTMAGLLTRKPPAGRPEPCRSGGAEDTPPGEARALGCGDMAQRSTLVAVSSAQLLAQLAGHLVALRRRRHFDVPFMTGSAEHLVRDWLWFGTAYSAPPYLLAPQIWAIARLLRGPDDRARWVLQRLGAGLTLGYPSERWNRVRLRRGGFDPLETPIVAAGWSCAMAMAVLARR